MTRSNSSSDDSENLRQIHTSFATQRSITALILREMSTTYGRSPGGYIWAILEPVAGIALLTVIFSAGFRTPPLGTLFALFYATGLLPFIMYGDISNKLSQTMNFSRALLEYPRVTFIDALLARFLLSTLTQLMVHFFLIGGIFLIYSPHTTLDFKKIFVAYLVTLILAFGIGTINSFLTLAYPVWQTIWAVMNRPIFLISCLFFLFETVPQPWSDILWYNPLVHVMGLMRDGYYPYYNPSYTSVLYPSAVGAILTIVGLFLLNRYHRDILDK